MSARWTIGTGSRRLEGAILGAALVAAVSWTVHAGATEGSKRALHLLANSLHLLVAAVWLGAQAATARRPPMLRRRSDVSPENDGESKLE